MRGQHPASTQPIAPLPGGRGTPTGRGHGGGAGLVAPGSEAMAPDKRAAGAEQRESDLIAVDHVSAGTGTPAADLLTA